MVKLVCLQAALLEIEWKIKDEIINIFSNVETQLSSLLDINRATVHIPPYVVACSMLSDRIHEIVCRWCECLCF